MKTKHPLPNMNVIDIEKEKAIIAAAQAKLKEHEEAVKEFENNQARVVNAKKDLQRRQDEGKTQVEHTEAYFKQIQKASTKFTIKYDSKELDLSPMSYSSNYEDRENIVEVKGDITSASIVFNDDPKVCINVREHFTSTNSWRSRSQGYKMYTNGLGYKQDNKAYKNAKTIIQQIQDHYDTKISAKNEADVIASMIKDTDWDAVYPGAKVHEETIYVGKWRGRNYDKYHSHHRGICLTLVNGITIVMRPYAYDQSWSIQSIKYPTPTTPTGSTKEILGALNNMKF